jgi:two-component system sensor histidine kinase PilS (NtrC family)
MAAAMDDNLEYLLSRQRATNLKVYNYYRTGLSFALLYVFLGFDGLVGNVNPELFQTTIISYIGANVVILLLTLFVPVETLSKPAPSLFILVADILFMTFILSASGGVSSGLGSFLMFPMAFGGSLVTGRVSTVLPAIAATLLLYNEFYLSFLLERDDLQLFFQAGILGIVYFVTNILFQTLSGRLQSRSTEVYTLEQINHLIIDQMRTGVVVISDDESPRLMNHAAERILYDPRLTPEPRLRLPEPLLENVRLWKKNQRERDIMFAAREAGPLLVANFSILETPSPEADTLVFLEDSSEVQRQAQQLKLASLGRLSASIAHEIRNPLGAISHAAQLLGESNSLDKGDLRLAEIIQNHSVRMNDVIENVLQMSRRKSAEPKDLDLGEFVSAFLIDFTAGMQNTVDIHPDIQTGMTVSADPLQLSQVLGNLCQNGLRYSEKETGEAKLELIAGLEEDSNKPYLDVIDFGTGVDEDLIANLFEPFYTTETTGTGLGLYLSKELCEANNASINYVRADAGGGCFRILFRG